MCTTRVVPFSVGEYTFWKKQALCITNQNSYNHNDNIRSKEHPKKSWKADCKRGGVVGSTLTGSLRSCKISVFSWRLAYRTGNLALYGLLSSKAEFTARRLSKSEYHNYLSTCGAKNSVHTFFKSMLRVIFWLQSSFFLHSPQSPRSWDEENCVPDDKYYENADIASFSSVHGLSCAPPFILPFTEIKGRNY